MTVLTAAAERLGGWGSRRYALITERPLAARGTAALRIGYGTLWALFLLREYPEREAAWGPGSAWSPAMERAYEAYTPMPGWLRDWLTSVAGLGGTGFEAFYLLAVLAGVLFAVGWRTRISSLLFCFVVVAVENRSPLITDGGDNVLVLMSIFLCFTRCGRHWSLDARRRARHTTRAADADATDDVVPGWRRELAAAREQIVNVLHNGAVLVIAFQVCVIYATAGLYKVQGSMWQDGTAMDYVLRLHWFEPWPGLDSWLLGHSSMLALAGYATVLVQVGFPFCVFTPRLKYPSLAVLAVMHLSIAVVLGLPFFSLLMLVGDAVFLSDRVWLAVERGVAGPAYAGGMGTGAGTGTGTGMAAGTGVGTAAGGTFTGTPDGPASVGSPTLVFDGDCGFCSSTVRWAERWCRPAVRFVPWQRLDLAAHGLTLEAVTSSVQYLRPDEPGRAAASGAAAVARTLLRSRWPFRPLGAVLSIPPFSWLGERVYRIVSDNRYRLPGGTPACAAVRDDGRGTNGTGTRSVPGSEYPTDSDSDSELESGSGSGSGLPAQPEARTSLDELLGED